MDVTDIWVIAENAAVAAMTGLVFWLKINIFHKFLVLHIIRVGLRKITFHLENDRFGEK